MAYRPKHSEKEEDLFRLQSALAAGQLPSSGVQLVKRKGETDSGIDDVKKKSRRSQEEEEDVAALMEDGDRHVTVVLSKIQERAPSPLSSGPLPGPLPGPRGSPRVLRLDSSDRPASDRRSLFARHMDRLRVGASSRPAAAPPPATTAGVGMAPSRLVTGVGLGAAAGEEERERIHSENLQRLEGLSSNQIEAERERLMRELDPGLVAFLMRGSPQNTDPGTRPPPVDRGAKCRSAEDVERQKLAWIQEVKLPEPGKGQTQARFDFNGDVVAVDAPVPVQEGLHHHGDEAERAGYTPAELFTLARSANLRQRQLALRTLARCCAAARSGRHLFALQAPLLPSLCRAGLPFLLRWAADDASEPAALTAVSGLASLLCEGVEEEEEEEWVGGKPQTKQQKDDDEEEEEQESDLQLMQRDLILGLLRTDLLQRLAFLTEKMAPRWRQSPTDDAAAFCDLLRLLTALARHSRAVAHRIATHRRLLRALLPLCSVPPAGEVLQERKRLALRLQRALCSPSASLCRSHCHEFHLVTDVFDLLSSTEITDQLQAECLHVLTVLLNHSVEVPAISSRAASLEAAMRRAMECSRPPLPLLNAWVTFVSAGVTSLCAFPSGQWLEGLAATAEEVCAREVERFGVRLERERLPLLASCLHCAGCILELQQNRHPACGSIGSAAFAARWHDRIAAALVSPSLRALLQELKPQSWFLLAALPGQFEDLLPPGLLPAGSVAHKRLEDGSVTAHTPSCRPFGALAAFCRLLTLHWADKDWARLLLTNLDLRRYLLALLSIRTPEPLPASPLLRAELRCLTDLLQLTARRGPPEDPQPFLGLALRLLQHLHPCQAATARQLLTRIVFAPPFTDLTPPSGLTDRLGLLDLSEAGPAAVLEDLRENLSAASGAYLNLISAPSPAANDEPCARLLPPDWPFLPLLRLHQRAPESNEEDEPGERRSLLHCLRLLSFLELSSRRLGLPLSLSPPGRFVRLLSFFLRCGDLFLEPVPAAHLAWQLRILAERAPDPAEVEAAASEIFVSFSDLYSTVLKEFFAASYGCPLFSSFVLLPAAARFPPKIRRALWREGREGLRMMRMEPGQCLFDVRALLEEDPRDSELLRLQAEALLSGALQSSSLLFLVALHALNRALFAHAPPGTARRRFQGLVARGAGPDLAKQLFFYKDFAEEAAFYSELPPIRATYLEALLREK